MGFFEFANQDSSKLQSGNKAHQDKNLKINSIQGMQNLFSFQTPFKFLKSIHWSGDIGSIYTGLDPFGTGTKLVWISLVFTRDLEDPVRIGSAIWYEMSPLMKVIPYGTVPFQFRTGPV